MAKLTCARPFRFRHSSSWLVRPLQACLCGLLLTITATGAPGAAVSGKVFLDRNGDGAAQESEPALAGVVVSDGKALIRTSLSGQYSLETDPGRLVFVTLPKGYRASKSFYAKATAGQPLDFGLVEWPQSKRGPVRFVQITDIHIANKEDTVTTFIEDIAEINALQPEPAFVMTTGDLVNVGKETEQYDNYVRGIGHFRAPLFNLPGNHDAKAPGSMEHYHRYLGPDYYSFNVGDCHFIMLNCLDFGDQQKAWITNDLAMAPKGATRFFALHFLPTRQQVEWMRQMGAAAVLSGHWHGNRVEQGLGVLDMNTPPLRFGGIDRHPRSFRIVEVKGGKVTDELRLGGFNHHAVVVSPSGTCAAPGGRLPVVVNAYDTRYEAAAVECQVAGKRASLKRVSPWSWMGEIKLPAGTCGRQSLQAEIRATNGDTWRANSDFEIPQPAASGEAPLCLKWAAPTGGFIGISSPQRGSKLIILGVDDKGDLKSCGVSAFTTQGKLRWHFNTDSAIKNNIAIAGGRVYATSVAGWLYALSEDSGKLLWKQPLNRERERWEVAATTVAEGLVFVGAHSYVAAFDAQSGKRVWERQHGANDWWPSCYTIPTVTGGKLLLATRGGAYALEVGTGRQLWKLDGKFNGSLVAGNTLYTTRNGVLCAVGLSEGKVIWAGKENVGDTASAPALAGDKLLIGTAEGRVCAFSTRDGSLVWSTQTGTTLSSLQPYQRGQSDVNSSPAVLGERVYVGASDGKLHALEISCGKKIAAYPLGTPIASSPCIAGDTLYIGAYDGNVYAFALTK